MYVYLIPAQQSAILLQMGGESDHELVKGESGKVEKAVLAQEPSLFMGQEGILIETRDRGTQYFFPLLIPPPHFLPVSDSTFSKIWWKAS